MTWLLLSIICSTLIFIIFKLFVRFRIDNLQAIVVNYFVAGGMGTLLHQGSWPVSDIIHKDWLISAVIIGFLFITLFQVMALVSQKIGVSVVSVAVKMSLVIPVSFAVVYFGDEMNWLKATGTVLALIAVYLATRKKEKIRVEASLAWLPILLFIGSGFLDAFLKFNQATYVPVDEHSIFTAVSFGMAAFFGLIFIAVKKINGNFNPAWRNLIGGIALGIPNYGSIYFLLRALDFEGIESSVIFPLNNVGIVLLSVLIGVVAFREKLSTRNKIGIILAVLAISCIIADNY